MMFRRRLAALTIATIVIGFGSVFGAVAAEAGGGGCHEPVTDGRGTNVDLKGSCMITTILRVDPGATVTFTNRDEIDHTVTGAGIRSGDGTSFGSFEPLASGKSVAHTFQKNGVYVYYCYLHPGMVGAIVVGDGTGSGAASGDGAAPAGVTRLTASDIDGRASRNAPSAASAAGGADISRALTLLAMTGVTLLVLIGSWLAVRARSRRRLTARAD